jgi:hypothetical protein
MSSDPTVPGHELAREVDPACDGVHVLLIGVEVTRYAWGTRGERGPGEPKRRADLDPGDGRAWMERMAGPPSNRHQRMGQEAPAAWTWISRPIRERSTSSTSWP